MDKLEFENFDIEDLGRSQKEETPQGELLKGRISEEAAIELSNKIIGALDKKAKKHNKEHPGKKVTLTQLKKVYRSGAVAPHEDKGLWAMARVNMFLRMKMGINVATATDAAKTFKINEMIDISAGWAPTKEDLDLAKEDIKEYSLFGFDSIDDLYIEEYQKINTWITWG